MRRHLSPARPGPTYKHNCTQAQRDTQTDTTKHASRDPHVEPINTTATPSKHACNTCILSEHRLEYAVLYLLEIQLASQALCPSWIANCTELVCECGFYPGSYTRARTSIPPQISCCRPKHFRAWEARLSPTPHAGCSMQQASDVASYPILCGIFEMSLLVSGQTMLATSLQDFKTALRQIRREHSAECRSIVQVHNRPAACQGSAADDEDLGGCTCLRRPLVDPSKPSSSHLEMFLRKYMYLQTDRSICTCMCLFCCYYRRSYTDDH